MATVPAGNPNELSSRAHHDLFQNHAAMDTIEPGSVMKPFIAAAALEEQEVTSETPIDCELGSWVIDGKTIRDDHPKGVISVSEVIKYSSNIGAAKLGLMLGGERTLGYLKNFGFGRSSGLGLPGEVAGLMRSPASIRRLELANTAFGQGITASPIQLTAAVASLANGGVRMMPYLVEAVLDRHGDVETEYEPRIDRRVISEDTARLVTLMMESVIEEGGTGTRARIPGYKVAGKTGTAQKAEAGGYSATKRISSFVGFVPADRPVLAMTVVVDSATIGSRYGGIVAAPVFAEVGAFSMRYLGIEPSPELAAPPRIDTADSTTITESIVLVPDGIGGWVLPDLTGKSMRSVLASLQASGLAVRVEGSGWVSAQAPPAGTSVSAGDSVFITFQ
jgi:cell division protein FtsI (penicillin-binding protein 3)